MFTNSRQVKLKDIHNFLKVFRFFYSSNNFQIFTNFRSLTPARVNAFNSSQLSGCKTVIFDLRHLVYADLHINI